MVTPLPEGGDTAESRRDRFEQEPSAGRLRGLEEHIVQLTEQIRAMTEALLEAQRRATIGILAAGVAHNLNNLLTSVVGYIMILMERIRRGEGDLMSDVESLKTSVELAAVLSKQLMNVARETPFHPQLVDMQSLLIAMENLLNTAAGKPNILRIAEASPGQWIMADPGEIKQILLNLVLNARDAIHTEHGNIVIQCSTITVDGASLQNFPNIPRGEYVCMRISDNGQGMDEATQSRLFEPFFTTKSDQGNGLGLFMIKTIVDKHHGVIQVESKVGEGTTFSIYFPIAPASPQSLSEVPAI